MAVSGCFWLFLLLLLFWTLRLFSSREARSGALVPKAPKPGEEIPRRSEMPDPVVENAEKAKV